MSRKSSATSISTFGSSSKDDDPLMRDCYELRRRLLQTERSLKSLNPPRINNGVPPLDFGAADSRELRENMDERYLFADKMAANRDSDNAKSISIAEWQEIFGNIDNDEVMGIPRSDELPPLPEPQESSEDESSESQMWPSSREKKPPASPSSENIPVLTLADLTPIHTDTETMISTVPSLNARSSSFPDLRHEPDSSYSSPREIRAQNGHAKLSTGSLGGHDHDSMRRKLLNLREENTRLFSQNNKLMTELENTGYELHEYKTKLKKLDTGAKAYQVQLTRLEDRITMLEGQLSESEQRVRISEEDADIYKRRLLAKENEIEKANNAIKEIEKDYTEELRHRRSLETKLEESLHTAEELSENVAELQDKLRNERKQYDNSEQKLKESLRQADVKENELLEKIRHLGDQLSKTNSDLRKLQNEKSASDEHSQSFEDEREALKSTIARQNTRIGHMEEDLHNFEDLKQENVELKEIIDGQNARIHDYETEIEETKSQMARLENLVQKVQEQTIKDKIMSTPATTDSGIGNSYVKQNGYLHPSPRPNGSYTGELNDSDEGILNSSGGSARAIVADLRLKLAVKDAEIQKLQSALTAKTAAHQRQISGLDGEVGAMDSLRSELSTVIERSRMSDRKQQELERIITRLEDEASRYSTQIMELEERLTDKMAQNATLEGKVSQRNSKISELQIDIEKKIDEINNLEHERNLKSSEISNLQKNLNGQRSQMSQYTSEVQELKSISGEQTKKISELEESLIGKETEVKETNGMIDRVKQLHAEHCRELEQQIELLQQRFDAKVSHIAKLETALVAAQNEVSGKRSLCDDLNKELQESKHTLQERASQLAQHEIKLKNLQAQTNDEAKKVEQLETSLSQCKTELASIIQQTEKEKAESEKLLISKNNEIRQLSELVGHLQNELEEKEQEMKSIGDSLRQREQMLVQSQHRISELEESQDSLQENLLAVKQNMSKERSTVEEELEKLRKKLRGSTNELEERTKQIHDLDIALKEVHSELKLRSEKSKEMEGTLETARVESQQKSTEISTLKSELDSLRVEYTQKENDCKVAEEKLRDTEMSLNESSVKASDLDQELQSASQELKQTIEQLSELQSVLSQSQKEAQENGEKVTELDRMLNESQDELQQKELELREQEHRIAEMDKALKERQWEIKQKAVQVTQLDMSFKEQKSELQHKLLATEHNLNQTQLELSQMTVQNAELKATVDHRKDELRDKSLRIEQLEKTVRQQQQEMKTKSGKIADFEKEIQRYNLKEEDEIHLKQELRLTKDQVDQLHKELQVHRQELFRAQRAEQDLTKELDDCHTLLASKEADCTRLARELGASQVREAQSEARAVQELRKFTQHSDFKLSQKEQELDEIQDKHTEILTSREQELTKLRLTLQRIEDESNLRLHDLERCQKRISEQDEDIKSLTREVQLQQQHSKELSEHLLIKDAEIARLEARISGYERATFGMRHGKGSGPSSPRTSSQRRSPPPRRPTSALPSVRKKTSSYTLDDHNISGVHSMTPLVPSLLSSSQQLTPEKQAERINYSRAVISPERYGLSVARNISHELNDSSSGTVGRSEIGRFQSFEGLLRRATDGLNRQDVNEALASSKPESFTYVSDDPSFTLNETPHTDSILSSFRESVNGHDDTIE